MADVLDKVIQLFDQAISSRESRARFKMIDELAERAKSGEDRQALLDMLTIVTDAAIQDRLQAHTSAALARERDVLERAAFDQAAAHSSIHELAARNPSATSSAR